MPEHHRSKRLLARRSARRLILLSAFLTALVPAVSAEIPTPATLVGDLNTTLEEQSGAPFAFVTVGETIYFTARTPQHGFELWTTDGTAEGTSMVFDLCPGTCDARPIPLAVTAGRLFFVADDGATGRELWTVTPGTSPAHLGDLCPGVCDADVFSVAVLEGELYFRADDGRSGAELWRSDGTPGGTRRVADICAGECGSDPRELTAFGDRIYFAADDGVDGRELWRSDGTPAGTERVVDLCLDCDAAPAALTVDVEEDRLVFGADDGASGREPWATDGTAAGTHRIADLRPGASGSDPRAFHRLLGTLYVEGDCEENPACVWKRTADGFVLAGELFPRGFGDRPFELLEIGDRIFFTAGRKILSSGERLWSTDGTEAGTTLVHGPPPSGAFTAVRELTATSEGGLIFSGRGNELWLSDGTVAGTRSLETSRPGSTAIFPRQLTPTPVGILFSAQTDGEDTELWISDGTAEGTRELLDLAAAEAASSPAPQTALGPRLLFRATVGRFGRTSLFASEGGAGETLRLAEGFFSGLITTEGLAVYSVGSTVFSTDGTMAGTRPVTEIGGLQALVRWEPGLFDQPPVLIYSGLPEAVFEPVAATGQKLWRRTLASGPDELIVDPYPDWSNQGCFFDPCVAPPVLPARFTESGPSTFFLASEEGTPIQLWVTGGTPETSRRLHTFDTGNVLEVGFFGGQRPELFPDDFVPFARGVVFTAFERASGFEPWVSDGTVAGTRSLGDLVEGEGTSDPRAYTALGQDAFFFARTVGGDALWRTDGSPDGTAVVTLLEHGGDPAFGVEMVASGDRLFFTAFSSSTGLELWTSDGTKEGTALVADLRPGPLGSGAKDLAAVGRQVLFSADDGVSGHEPWASDGTEIRQLLDLHPGAAASSPTAYTVAGPKVFFSADDGIHGRELWAIPTAAVAAPTCITGGERLCLGGGRFEVRIRWHNRRDGSSGTGRAVSGTDDSGYFWFFQPDNLEAIVKVLDGDPVNGHFWVFAGVVTDLEYEVTVTDLETGRQRSFAGAGGNLCGFAETRAFPSASPGTGTVVPRGTEAGGSGSGILGRRFLIETTWRDPRSGDEGRGIHTPVTDRTGAFWFFEPANQELLVKVLDGRTVNGRFWVLYGALTDVEYRLTVTDLLTDEVRTYESTSRDLCGGADIEAFVGSLP